MDGNGSLSIEHMEEIQINFLKFMDQLISRIFSNNNDIFSCFTVICPILEDVSKDHL